MQLIKPHSLDIDTFVDFLSLLIKETFPFTYGRGYYEQVYHYDDQFSFVALVNGRKAGLLIAKLNQDPQSNRYYLDYQLVSVLKEYRHNGLGQKLFDASFDEVRKSIKNIDYFRLNVIADNVVAQKLYSKNGFRVDPTKTNDHMYWSGRTPLKGYEMRRNVTNNLREIDAF